MLKSNWFDLPFLPSTATVECSLIISVGVQSGIKGNSDSSDSDSVLRLRLRCSVFARSTTLITTKTPTPKLVKTSLKTNWSKGDPKNLISLFFRD